MTELHNNVVRTIYDILVNCRLKESTSNKKYKYYVYDGFQNMIETMFEILSNSNNIMIKTNIEDDSYICILLYILGSAYDNCYLGFDELHENNEDYSIEDYISCFGIPKITNNIDHYPNSVVPYITYDTVPSIKRTIEYETMNENKLDVEQKIYGINELIDLIDYRNPGILFGG